MLAAGAPGPVDHHPDGVVAERPHLTTGVEEVPVERVTRLLLSPIGVAADEDVVHCGRDCSRSRESRVYRSPSAAEDRAEPGDEEGVVRWRYTLSARTTGIRSRGFSDGSAWGWAARSSRR